ncbi:MAG: hypothetical protein U0821_10680 [Chloroflexota bacterium]
MIVVMSPGAGASATAQVVRQVEAGGFGAFVFHGAERDVIAILGDPSETLAASIATSAGVERVDATTRPYRLASREVKPEGTVIPIGRAHLGRGFTIIAGSAEPRPAQELVDLAGAARQDGADIFWVGRGTSGDWRRDLTGALDDIRESVGLPVLVDAWEPSEVDRLSRHADALMVPAQQMDDRPLLAELGQGDRPIVICRGHSSRIEEWLMAADRAMQAGLQQVALCEQGIRTYESAVPATLDFGAIAMARRLTHLPLIANASLPAAHPTEPPAFALAAAAVGANAVILDLQAALDLPALISKLRAIATHAVATPS